MMSRPQPSCHICGAPGDHLMPWFRGGGEMRRCRDCDFVFAWPVEPMDPVHVYSQAYRGNEARTQMDDYARRLSRRDIVAKNEAIGLWSPAHHEALRWIDQRLPAGATVLEVGCGLGAFMRALQRRGYRAAGIDVAAPAVAAIRRDGLEAWCGTVDRAPEGWPDPAPAAIVSFFVLHHIPEPVAFFRAIRERWDAPIIIGYNKAPTKETAETNNFPPRCWGWWSERAVRRALERAGYTSVDVARTPKALPQIFLPDRLHDAIGSVLWRWPRLRVLLSPIVDRVLGAGYQLLRPVPRLRRSFEGGLLIIAEPANAAVGERYPARPAALEAER